jgi:hypothetical protein
MSYVVYSDITEQGCKFFSEYLLGTLGRRNYYWHIKPHARVFTAAILKG